MLAKTIGRLRRAKINAAAVARAQVYAGALLAAVGAALVFAPAGLLLAGGALVAAGLFLVDVDSR